MRLSCLSLLFLSSAALAQPADEARRDAERALFKQIVEYQTVAGRTEEFRKLTALLKKEFAKAGITDVIIKDHDDVQTLIARWPASRPSGLKPILLMAHMDVVDAKAEDWQNPPFELREKDGYYLGRGTADIKAEIAGLVLAMQQLRREGFEPNRDIIVLLTGDEESSGNGARLASTEWRDLIDSEYVINLDAGGGALHPDGRIDLFAVQIAEKTYADYLLEATNRGGHSSSPRPDNAIYALAGALKALEAHRFQPKLNDATRAQFKRLAESDKGRIGAIVEGWLENSNDREKADLIEAILPGYTRTRCVATTLSGGHAANALPQRAQANVNCRIFPGEGLDEIRDTLQHLAGPDVTVTLVPGSATPATEPTPIRDDLMAAFKAALAVSFDDAPLVPMMSSYATDGSFMRSAGYPVYGFSPMWARIGQSAGSHGLDERVPVEAFHGQVPILFELLQQLAG